MKASTVPRGTGGRSIPRPRCRAVLAWTWVFDNADKQQRRRVRCAKPLNHGGVHAGPDPHMPGGEFQWRTP